MTPLDHLIFNCIAHLMVHILGSISISKDALTMQYVMQYFMLLKI